MASNNRGGRGNRGRNNNPEGRNQYSGGVMDMARERPMTAAAVAAGTAAAGLFLWSKRSQISDQLSNISDQLSDWKQSYNSDDFGSDALISSGATGSSTNMGTKPRRSTKGKRQSQFAEEAMTLKQTGA